MKHYNIVVSGRVQGVNYRNSALHKAIELSVKGLVKNQEDSSVYIECEGSEAALQEFIDWCRQGPKLAKITHLDIREAPGKGFKDFQIER